MKRINLNIPQELLERLDAYCNKTFTNRAEVIRRLLLDFLNKQDETID